MQRPTQGAAFPASGTHQASLSTGLAWGEWKDLGDIHWLQPQSFSFVTQEAKTQLKVSPSHSSLPRPTAVPAEHASLQPRLSQWCPFWWGCEACCCLGNSLDCWCCGGEAGVTETHEGGPLWVCGWEELWGGPTLRNPSLALLTVAPLSHPRLQSCRCPNHTLPGAPSGMLQAQPSLTGFGLLFPTSFFAPVEKCGSRVVCSSVRKEGRHVP